MGTNFAIAALSRCATTSAHPRSCGRHDRMPTPAPKLLLSREERRAKREARRTKQREENVGRAAKMHEARLHWEQDHEARSVPVAPPSIQHVQVGCSGWFYWHWRGAFYPADLPTGRWFEH